MQVICIKPELAELFNQNSKIILRWWLNSILTLFLKWLKCPVPIQQASFLNCTQFSSLLTYLCTILCTWKFSVFNAAEFECVVSFLHAVELKSRSSTQTVSYTFGSCKDSFLHLLLWVQLHSRSLLPPNLWISICLCLRGTTLFTEFLLTSLSHSCSWILLLPHF